MDCNMNDSSKNPKCTKMRNSKDHHFYLLSLTLTTSISVSVLCCCCFVVFLLQDFYGHVYWLVQYACIVDHEILIIFGQTVSAAELFMTDLIKDQTKEDFYTNKVYGTRSGEVCRVSRNKQVRNKHRKMCNLLLHEIDYFPITAHMNNF